MDAPLYNFTLFKDQFVFFFLEDFNVFSIVDVYGYDNS